MKLKFTIIVILFIIMFINSEKLIASQKTYRYLKTILVDLNNDDLLDTIDLSSSIKSKNFFNKISISLTGFKKYVFFAKNKWTYIDKSFLKKNNNLISSNKLFVKKVNGQTVLLIFGNLSGSGYRDEFSIINIVDNEVKMVFDHIDEDIDVELPKTIEDIDNDGKLDFVYTCFREQAPPPKNFIIKGVFESYSPFLIYTVDNLCKLNKTLTKKYNQDNYVFAGFKYSEEIEVFIPAKGGHKRACKRDKDGRIIWLTK